MKMLLFSMGVFLLPLYLSSQNYYDKDLLTDSNKAKERKVIPWPYLKEADVFIVKKVERVIDVREKQNQAMVFPSNNLATILYESILENKLFPYESDSFNRIINLAKFRTLGGDTEFLTIPVDPNDPSYTMDTSIVNPFIPADRIKKFRLVELWLFDKSRSQYYVRIISIAPQYELKLGGVNLGWQDLCVLKYYSKDSNDIRHININHLIFNRQNDFAELSFDDWFEQRMFSSYITKIWNMHDLPIRAQSEFKDNGIEALLEGERKQKELIEREENLYED